MILKYYENDEQCLNRIVDILNDGGIVIYPSDTTYAFACHALRPEAAQRICKLKHTDPTKHPLTIVCKDLSEASLYARISNAAFMLMKRNTPGIFTFLLPVRNNLPRIFRGYKRKEVGIRIQKNPFVKELLNRLEAPIMTASLPAEQYDETEYQTDASLADEAFGNLVDIVIDGGEGKLGLTTIVDCSETEAAIIRQGEGVLQ